MVRRKRARQEASFYEVQESFRENARLMTMLQHSFTSSSSSLGNENATESRRRSPESMLYESPQVDLLQCHEELSPEIVPKISQVKLNPEDVHEDDHTEEVGEEIGLRKNERSESALFETRQSGRRNIARERIEQSVPSSLSEPDQIPGMNCERRPLLEGEWSPERDDFCGAVELDRCYLLNKTLSMNEDLAREMEKYLDEQSSIIATVTTSCHSVTKSSPLPDVAIAELQSEYIAESACSASLQKSNKCSQKFVNDMQSSLGDFEPLETSICETFDPDDRVCRDNVDQMRGKKPGDNKTSNVASEENGRPSTAANWREFRKVFAYLQRLNRKIRGEGAKCDAPLFSRHRFACDDRKFRYVSMTTPPPSSSSLASFRASLSPKKPKNRKNPTFTGSRNATRSALANERRSKFDELPQRAKRTESKPCQQGSITPCRGTSSGHRCRGILKFEDEDEEAEGEQRQLATACAEMTNDPILPQRKDNNEKHSYLLNLPSFVKTSWISCSSSESTPTSSVDLPAVPDYNCCGSHSQEEILMEYQDNISQNIMTLCGSRNYSLRRRNIPRVIIRKIATFCIWLYKKLLRLLDNSYKKLRRVIVLSSFPSQDIPSQSPRLKEFGHLIVTLRSENEKMLCTMSEKVARLSTEFVQVRTSIEAVLGIVTAEVNNVREVSRKMNENNMSLIQELKKLHKAMEEVQLKSTQQISPTTCFSSSSFPPVPLPPSLPPPSLAFPSKHATESASLTQLPPPPPLPPSSLPPPPPPPPPLPPMSFPSVSFQSPILSVIPTTPNNNEINRNNVTPTSKCSTPLLNRPSITVEDLLKVTLKKAPQSTKDNRRNTVPGPRGPVVSLDMLRNVKLKSARRRSNDQSGRSPRNGRIVKSRTVSTLSLSPIMAGSESNLERILRQDINRRGPRRLLSGSVSFRDHDFAKDDTRPQSLETLKHSQSQSAIA